MEFKNAQGLHAEDIGNDPHDMTPSGLAEGDKMSAMLGVVVAPPAYTDPSNPAAASGSVNLALDSHPLDVSEDYGEGIGGVAPAGVDSQSAVLNLDNTGSADGEKDEDEWTVADYKDALSAAGLSTSGNKAELAERWEEHEASQDDDNSNEQ